MKFMRTELVFDASAGIETELLAALAGDGQTGNGPDAKPAPVLLTDDEAVKAAAIAVLASGEFKGGTNETLLLHGPAGLKAKRLLLVGVGKLAKATAHSVRDAAGTAVRFAKPRGIREVVLVLPQLSAEAPPHSVARAAVEGAVVGDLDTDTYRSERKDQSVLQFTLVCPEAAADAAVQAALGAAYAEGVIVGESQNFARSLVNEPGNKLTPTVLGQRAAEMAQQVGLAWEVHSTEKLRELKMGAFLAVSQGSEEPPALIVLRYEPAGAAKDGPLLHPTNEDQSSTPATKERLLGTQVSAGSPVLGLVGKGITFDTGGISIKPSENMEKMKYDMAGGAAMLGAMRAIALLKPKVRVLAIVCSAENMPDGKAYKPGDVETAMPTAADKPGKTIEIINTDAEGRLVLADGLSYARQLGATHLIDAATLTGAIGVALGLVNAGAFANDEETFAKFEAGLKVSGEKFWRMPLGEEYADQIKSDIGDIKNTGGRYGGACTAAEFLHTFAEDVPWIHLDIAGMAWIDETRPYIAKGPSGVGVRSILEWVRGY
jgi:leucyl aminopeptidase